jgi:hypothetical protein
MFQAWAVLTNHSQRFILMTGYTQHIDMSSKNSKQIKTPCEYPELPVVCTGKFTDTLKLSIILDIQAVKPSWQSLTRLIEVRWFRYLIDMKLFFLADSPLPAPNTALRSVNSGSGAGSCGSVSVGFLASWIRIR